MYKSDIYGEKYADLWSYLGNLSHEQRIRTPYFEGLETPLDVGTRAGQCLLEALMNAEQSDETPRTILAVTHSTVLESLLASLFGADFDGIHTDNLCWIRFRVQQSRLVMDGSEGVSYKVSPDAIPMTPSCMSSFQACGFKTLLGGSLGLLMSMYLSGGGGGGGLKEEVQGDLKPTLNFCEGNFLVSHHIGEFFNTCGALILAFSGLHTSLRFQLKLQKPELVSRHLNSKLLAFSIAALGSSLAYSHITLSAEYMHLSEAMALFTLLLAIFSSGKESNGTEPFRSFTVFVVLYVAYVKSGFNRMAFFTTLFLIMVKKLKDIKKM
jgi:hypothetical protein